MNRLKNQSKNQIVYEMIRDAIISGEFSPGSRIIIDDLAARYGISHSPIRECLRLLEGDGFVMIRPYAGVTVTDLKPELIIEVFTLLESMEIISSCRASQRATARQLEKLSRRVEDMEDSTADQKTDWSDKNIQFHMAICDIAGMTMTRNMMFRALHHWDRLCRYYLDDVLKQRMPQAHQEHRDLLAAMRQRDEAAIVDVIQRHNRAALSDYLEHIKRTQQVDLDPGYPFS